MSLGVCQRCLCTEVTPCIMDGVPCAWATEAEDLCTACLTPEEAAELIEGAILLEDDAPTEPRLFVPWSVLPKGRAEP